MIQQKQEGTSSPSKKVVGVVPNAGGATAAPSLNIPQNSDDPVIVVSDAQDINQNTGKMSADGNVRVYYQDMMGAGPKVLLLRNAYGRADKVIFTERSQISQPGKRWIADRITMAIATKKVLAEGNTKAYIIQGAPAKAPNLSPAPANSALAMRTETKKSTNGGTGKNSTATESSISKNEIY
jgi:lipopolysaccharide assembly outer membrane protein LptD (OstA)